MNVLSNFILIILCISSSLAESKHYPMVVTRPIPYLDIYHQSIELIPFEASYVQNHLRADACKWILNSQYFKMKQEIYVDLKENNILSEMKQYYSKMLPHFYKQEVITSMEFQTFCFLPSCFPKESEVQYEYIPYQPYIKKKIYRNNTVYGANKQMMACLARQTRNNQLKEYFISLKLKPNSTDKKALVLSIYFVLSYNTQQKLVVEALVEEPSLPVNENILVDEVSSTFLDTLAISFIRTGINEYYVMGREQFYIRNNFYLPYSYTADPLCGKLLETGKLRVCASVMNSLSTDIQFWPTNFNVDYRCYKTSIYVPGDMRKSPNDYKEWLLSCKGRRANKPFTLYISTNDEQHSSVLAYQQHLDGTVRPAWLFEKVSPIHLRLLWP